MGGFIGWVREWVHRVCWSVKSKICSPTHLAIVKHRRVDEEVMILYF